MIRILIWKWISLTFHREKLCKLDGMVFLIKNIKLIIIYLKGIPVFIRRLTAEEVKNENEAPAESLLDRGKEVFIINLGYINKSWNNLSFSH